MTQKRKDNHSTEFGLWLREQKEIDSRFGYIATNLDYIWRNRRNKQWLMIEEKRFGRTPADWQIETFKMLDELATNDPNYRGFYYVKFENTNPDDGKTMINGKWASPNTLIKLLKDLRFEST